MRSTLVGICLSLFAGAAFAQSDRGSITGAITDQASAVVVNAAVEARNTATGAQFQTLSTDTGNYTLPQLPIGVYQLSVSMAGFKKYVQQGITVETAQVV